MLVWALSTYYRRALLSFEAQSLSLLCTLSSFFERSMKGLHAQTLFTEILEDVLLVLHRVADLGSESATDCSRSVMTSNQLQAHHLKPWWKVIQSTEGCLSFPVWLLVKQESVTSVVSRAYLGDTLLQSEFKSRQLIGGVRHQLCCQFPLSRLVCAPPPFWQKKASRIL